MRYADTTEVSPLSKPQALLIRERKVIQRKRNEQTKTNKKRDSTRKKNKNRICDIYESKKRLRCYLRRQRRVHGIVCDGDQLSHSVRAPWT